MAVVKLKDAVMNQGKMSYTIEADFMPMPDGTGLAFRASSVITPEGMVPLTLIPWGNISSVTNDVPPSFFDAPQPAGEDETDGPGELS